MTMHTEHETPWDDDCPRCQEWADDPFTTLDANNLKRIYDLAVELISEMHIANRLERGITDTQFRAIRVMEDHIMNQAKIDQALKWAKEDDDSQTI